MNVNKVFLLSLSLSQHGIRAKEENLILSCFPCHQLRETFRWPCFFPVTFPISQYFPVSRIVVRNHSPLANFPAKFSSELSGEIFRRTFRRNFPANFPANFPGDLFFRHRPYQKERLEEISNFCEGTSTKRAATRRPRAIFRPAVESHAPARGGAWELLDRKSVV